MLSIFQNKGGSSTSQERATELFCDETPWISATYVKGEGVDQLVLCECGEVVGKDKFKDYIKTSVNPSTPTFGHGKCGLIFNFIDYDSCTRFSSKAKLKVIARKFSDNVEMNREDTERFLLAVDRLKRSGNLTDFVILTRAFETVFENDD